MIGKPDVSVFNTVPDGPRLLANKGAATGTGVEWEPGHLCLQLDLERESMENPAQKGLAVQERAHPEKVKCFTLRPYIGNGL